MIPIFYDGSMPLWGKIVLAGITLVLLILAIRAYVRNRRL